ncbi:MAG: hypothetical protein U1F56_19165 [Rubrivivax sp.]
MNAVTVDPVLARTTARLLAAGAACGGALALLCAALAAWRLWQGGAPAAPALAVWLLLLPERVLALRLHFDARLFADLADTRHPDTALPALDRALQALQLRAAPLATRPLAQRTLGARRLLLWHAAVVTLQFTLLAGLLAAPLLAPMQGDSR